MLSRVSLERNSVQTELWRLVWLTQGRLRSARSPAGVALYGIETRSTSKTSVEFPGIVGGRPALP
jgi:hypothetical protein